jgi:K+-sensing histidine kinase KdpD
MLKYMELAFQKMIFPISFDFFYRVEKERSGNNNFGLGLSMVKNMVSLNNVLIEVKSINLLEDYSLNISLDNQSL